MKPKQPQITQQEDMDEIRACIGFGKPSKPWEPQQTTKGYVTN